MSLSHIKRALRSCIQEGGRERVCTICGSRDEGSGRFHKPSCPVPEAETQLGRVEAFIEHSKQSHGAWDVCCPNIEP
jgi:hypothetical protein